MQTANSAPVVRFLLWAALLLVLSGCGHNGRMGVEGAVTLDGRPLPQGSIQFTPLPGSAGPTAGAEIVGGKFAIQPSGGPFAGKFRVEITATKSTGRKVLDIRSNAMIDEYAQYLPARYNSESRLEAEVKSSGPNRLDYVLESK
jgi:hypothetical protein